MRFSSTLLAVAAALVVPALALDPNNCNTSDKKRDGADFILVEQADNANVASLAKVLKRVSVASVFKDGNHKMTTDSAGRKLWEKKSGFDDEDTDKWVPQGISSTADALDAGTYEGVDGWVVSWHRSDDKSARITFVNRSNDTYRHALLVYPHAADNFREVPIHAGGIMWYGDKLWIVDTSNGIRVFDLANIWQVDTGDAVGKSGDKYTAAGYRYVVPQIRWYKWSSSFPFRFSYLSLDKTVSPPQVLVGEYQTSTSVPIRMAKFDLTNSTTSRLEVDGNKTAKAAWAYCVGIERMQGAVSANGKIFISRSNGKSAGDMFGWVPGKAAHNNAGFFPPSPEDLSYDKRRGGRIYGLTESAGKRYILDYEAKAVKFS
ncbi:49f1fe06-abb7-48a6-a6b2-d4d8d5115b50 [Thermothielavioides terrestris]|uniref:Secreted protein n=2 Tax=Thermothielavioides terrestris TaxID=2587410 RepID=G2RAT9_THETT|nr:uncharacterized protein THITE_2120498 [Thermothielavioides terrestris NRRL 8126]AEO69770.1 hypothetical protein THITE_2120498 [Thermothielavioides terrestris NRRL 8126]SPQ26313.1 49f1fe06-abb7-48a6-a6b2-d4d8d5115b50 [Thermothielavioides terrestris]